MLFSEWLQPPRRLLALFLVVTVVPASGLLWLGWYLLRQDRALADQRMQERRERAADLLVAGLEARLRAIDRDLADARVRRDMAPDGDAVVVEMGSGGVEAFPPGRLPYAPVASACHQPADAAFTAGEEREFRFGDQAGAIARFRVLASSPDPAVRAGAQLRIARNLRKAAQPDAALAMYGELAQSRAPSIGCVPTDLLARRARCVVLEESGRTDDLRREARELYADLRRGRWRVNRDVYDLHAQDLRGWLGIDAAEEGEGRALATAAAWLWERRPAPSPGTRIAGRHSMDVDGRFVTVVWTTTPQGVAGLIAGPRFATDRWLADLAPILDVQRVRLVLKDSSNRSVLGTLPASELPRAQRAAADTGLPWTVLVATADPDAERAELAERRRLLLAGLALVAMLVSAGSYVAARAFMRELAAARLQSDFVAAVSHEFRTPLASLRQLTENLLDGRVTTDARRLTYYQAQSRATERLHRLVEGLLDFGRMEAGVLRYRLVPIDAEDLVRAVVNEFRQDGAVAGHEIELEVGGPLPAVTGDREALTRAVWNLLDNAVKYSPQAPAVHVDVAPEHGAVVIRVRDRGIGIAADEQPSIGRKFFRGSAAAQAGVKGTGIGLAMVRHIVKAHGGSLRLESTPGVGSTFTIVLPGGTRPTGGSGA
jgi:signal transduction histidine kinase